MIIKLQWKIPPPPHHVATGAVVTGVTPPTGVVVVEVPAKIKVVPTSQVTPKDKNHNQTRFIKPVKRHGIHLKKPLTLGQVPNQNQAKQFVTTVLCHLIVLLNVTDDAKISVRVWIAPSTQTGATSEVGGTTSEGLKGWLSKVKPRLQHRL